MKKILFLLSFVAICGASFAVFSTKKEKEKIGAIPMAVQECGFASQAEAQAAGELWKNTHIVPRSAIVSTTATYAGMGFYVFCYQVYWNVVII